MASRYFVNSGNWSDTNAWSTTSGGAGGADAPTTTDDAFLDANSGTKILSILNSDSATCQSFNCTGFTGTVSFGPDNYSSYLYINGGNVTFVSGMTLSFGISTVQIQFNGIGSGSGSYNLTTGGLNMPAIYIYMSSGETVILQDNLTSLYTIALDRGKFNSNNFNVTTPLFSGDGTGPTTLTMGSSTWTLTGQGTVWTSSNLLTTTITPGTSTIIINDTSSTEKIFRGKNNGTGFTYNNLTITGDNVTIQDSNTFNVLTPNNPALTNGTKFQAGSTQTITSLSATGTAGNTLVMRCDSVGNKYTLSDASGTNTCDYLDIQDCAATGGATWTAGANSIDRGNNTGWTDLLNLLANRFHNIEPSFKTGDGMSIGGEKS